jgi:hypothetical protein
MGDTMNKSFVLSATVVLCFVVLLGAASDVKPIPQFTADNQLLRPENYREWIFLSAGYGMNYNAAAGDHQMFTNVFVPQWAYKEFMSSGKWPDQTTFVVEERMSQSKGSINKVGNFQVDSMGMGVEVKDSRQPDTWAYYNFGEDTKSAKANPKAGCFQCHEDHAAVEHSFVQFYPTLKPVAKKYGTYRAEREKVD